MEISDRLGRLSAFYDREAGKCLRGRAYLAACVMQGAALEASLHAMCFLYPEEIKKTSVYQKKKFRTKRNKALEFKYYELINSHGSRQGASRGGKELLWQVLFTNFES
jgi:hypothetical protein